MNLHLPLGTARKARPASLLQPGTTLPASSRNAAIEQTYRAAPQHGHFQQLVAKGDQFRDAGEFKQAERHYGQALRIFPLHGGYKVQFAHCLKEQERYPEAFVQYWHALVLGAARGDVEEHALFAADRADIRVTTADVTRRVAAFSEARQARSDWEVPPIEEDFVHFSDLFWGDRGLLTAACVIPLLLTCHTRKALFIRFLGSPETLRRNRPLLVMLNKKGLPDV